MMILVPHSASGNERVRAGTPVPGNRDVTARRPKPTLLVLGLALLVPLLCPGVRSEQLPSLGRASVLFAQRRYFELKALLEAFPADTRPQVQFFRGMMAAAFNRPEASVGYLNAFLGGAGERASLLRRLAALRVLADDYLKLFRYGLAAECRAQVLSLSREHLDPAAIADSERVIAFWRSLDAYPAQTAVLPESAALPIVGETEVMADFGGRPVALLIDTGASLSLITAAEAERLGLHVLDVTTQVGTATGEGIMARPAVVPEMRLGDIVIRNAVFLVVPQSMLYFPEIKKQRSGVLGFPILSALGEITFDREGTLVVPGRPAGGGEPNFFLYQDDPVVEAEYGRARALFMLDTGAVSTELFPPFFKMFQDEIKAHGIPGQADVEGVGSDVKVPVYLLGGLHFRVAGRDLVFHRDLVVLTKPTSEGSEIFEGMFGTDLLSYFSRVTINYAAMRITLER